MLLRKVEELAEVQWTAGGQDPLFDVLGSEVYALHMEIQRKLEEIPTMDMGMAIAAILSKEASASSGGNGHGDGPGGPSSSKASALPVFNAIGSPPRSARGKHTPPPPPPDNDPGMCGWRRSPAPAAAPAETEAGP